MLAYIVFIKKLATKAKQLINKAFINIYYKKLKLFYNLKTLLYLLS